MVVFAQTLYMYPCSLSDKEPLVGHEDQSDEEVAYVHFLVLYFCQIVLYVFVIDYRTSRRKQAVFDKAV